MPHADPTIIRLIWVLLTLFAPTLFVDLMGYVVAWLIVPEAGFVNGETR